MKNESYIESLMDFNMRVLSQGYIDTKITNYPISVLRDRHFFNKVFISNCKEMYQRHDVDVINHRYESAILDVKNNIDGIRSLINSLPIPVMIEEYTDDISSIISMITFIEFESFDIDRLNIDDGKIYYVTKSSQCYIMAICDDIEPEMLTSYHGSKKIYYNSSISIMKYMMDYFETSSVISFNVIRNEFTGTISKVEVSAIGESDSVNTLLKSSGMGKYNVVCNDSMDTSEMTLLFDQLIPRNDAINTPHTLTPTELFQSDVLLEYPRDSYSDYLKFLRSILSRGIVMRFMMTLYRVGDDVELYDIIRLAVQMGVEVTVNIELYASGELVNKVWVKRLTALGVKVYTYKSGKVKVHTKLTMIELITGDIISQIGTGNYHPRTSKEYCDLSLLTTDPLIGINVMNIFRLLSGADYSKFDNNVLVTRNNVREGLYKLIDQQADMGIDGYISIKCNALDDVEIIRHLEKAADSGCKMDLCIRGVCTWNPDYARVKIRSLVWDKLEHSRLYCFGIQNPTVYMGSLDLVTSKLDGRIEVLVRVNNPDAKIQCIDYLNGYNADIKHSWLMVEKGKYIKEEG